MLFKKSLNVSEISAIYYATNASVTGGQESNWSALTAEYFINVSASNRVYANLTQYKANFYTNGTVTAILQNVTLILGTTKGAGGEGTGTATGFFLGAGLVGVLTVAAYYRLRSRNRNIFGKGHLRLI